LKKILSEIFISAPPWRVFEVVMDFDRYPRWNCFTPRITLRTGVQSRGEQFDLDCRMTDAKLLKNEHEEIIDIRPDTYSLCMGTSRSRGRPGIKSFRWQICHPLDGGATRFVNYEEFHGPLAPLVHLFYSRKLKTAFDKYCAALKKEAESR
jgi:hypothetical protein